jgi:hypothetical protein
LLTLGGALTKWVWSRGIAALCDVRIPDESQDGDGFRGVPLEQQDPSRCIPPLDKSLATTIQDRQLVWVHERLLRRFVKDLLPYIRARFVLATGADDRPAPSSYLPEARRILESSNVIHWFAQEYDGTVGLDRVSPLPIGIDFHTLAHKPFLGEPRSSPVEQEKVLESVRRGLSPIEQRLPLVYADFTSAFGWFRRLILRIPRPVRRIIRQQQPLVGASSDELRGDVFNRLRRNPLVRCQRARLSRTALWRTWGRHAFVVSPHGSGLDCHRTWEALVLGNIVLVKSSSLDPLYAGMRVQVLNDWNEITPANLRRWLDQHKDSLALDRYLENSYWISKMRSVAAEG